MIENTFERIAEALINMEKALSRIADAQTGAPSDPPAPTIKPAEVPGAPPPPPAQPAAPVQPQASVLPFQQPEPLPPQQTAAVPFQDVPGLVAYTMKTYTELGAEKGAKIQGVLTGLGYDNINNVKPEHFASYYQQVEALKTGG